MHFQFQFQFNSCLIFKTVSRTNVTISSQKRRPSSVFTKWLIARGRRLGCKQWRGGRKWWESEYSKERNEWTAPVSRGKAVWWRVGWRRVWLTPSEGKREEGLHFTLMCLPDHEGRKRESETVWLKVKADGMRVTELHKSYKQQRNTRRRQITVPC